MRHRSTHTPLVLCLLMLLVRLPVLGANAPVGKVIPQSGSTALNGVKLNLETTLMAGDTVVTRADSRALIQLLHGDWVTLGPASKATVTAQGEKVVVMLKSGTTLIRSGNGHPVYVKTRGLVIRPSGRAAYQVASDGNVVLVASRQGRVKVIAANRSVVVPPGEARKIELPTNPLPGQTGVGGHSLAPAAKVSIVAAVATAAVFGGLAIANGDGTQVFVAPKAPVSPSQP